MRSEDRFPISSKPIPLDSLNETENYQHKCMIRIKYSILSSVVDPDPNPDLALVPDPILDPYYLSKIQKNFITKVQYF